ncbi:MAG TPA: hypothetical protein P5061_06865 [Mycobacterium sp.]|nr:hypothetical protein [Mycobacterium sp.]
MHGALFDPYPPAFIPHEVDMVQVQEQVAADGVSAPAGVDRSALEQVVTAAGNDGIELKIVVIEDNPPIDTPLRDIANEVGQQHPGATVLVLSPSFAGTYSPSYDRATLEAGEDLAKTGNPVQSAENFVSQLNTPIFPWTALTVVLLAVVVLGAALARVAGVRARRRADPESACAAEG